MAEGGNNRKDRVSVVLMILAVIFALCNLASVVMSNRSEDQTTEIQLNEFFEE